MQRSFFSLMSSMETLNWVEEDNNRMKLNFIEARTMTADDDDDVDVFCSISS
jgi:hypothetical protein